MEKETEEKSNEFNKVIDAASNFLKAIFPHTFAFIKSLKNKKNSENDKNEKKI